MVMFCCEVQHRPFFCFDVVFYDLMQRPVYTMVGPHDYIFVFGQISIVRIDFDFQPMLEFVLRHDERFPFDRYKFFVPGASCLMYIDNPLILYDNGAYLLAF